MLAHSLPSFRSLALFSILLSPKEALKAKTNYQKHVSFIGNLLYSVCQLSETVITIGHHAHTLIDKILKKSYVICHNFEWLGKLVTKCTWINQSICEIRFLKQKGYTIKQKQFAKLQLTEQHGQNS